MQMLNIPSADRLATTPVTRQSSHAHHDHVACGRGVSCLSPTGMPNASRLSVSMLGASVLCVSVLCASLLGASSAFAQASDPTEQGGGNGSRASDAGPSEAGRAAFDNAPDDGYGALFDEPPRRMRKLGLMFDLGTLDGGMMSLVYRPLRWVRLHGGGGTNGAGPGVRAGAAVSPFENSGWSLSLDGGHFFPGNVNGVFAAFAGSDYDDSHLLEHFDYDFVNLQVGWEVERGDLLFFARGGVGLLWTQLPSGELGRVRNLSSFVDADGSVEALLPSLKVGIIGFL